MSLTSRPTAFAALCVVLFACGSSRSSSSNSTSRSSSASTNGGGGCGGTADRSSEIGGRDVTDAPDRGASGGAPSEPAPTGMGWQPIETDEGCGRSRLRWVLVDEVCGDGDGADPRALEAPMFRDGAVVGSHLLAVDGTHVWSLDLAGTDRIARASLTTGSGQPLAARARGSSVYLAAREDGLVVLDASDPARPTRRPSLKLPAAAFEVDLNGSSAYLAIGQSGVAVVDVATGAPTLAATYAVPGPRPASRPTTRTSTSRHAPASRSSIARAAPSARRCPSRASTAGSSPRRRRRMGRPARRRDEPARSHARPSLRRAPGAPRHRRAGLAHRRRRPSRRRLPGDPHDARRARARAGRRCADHGVRRRHARRRSVGRRRRDRRPRRGPRAASRDDGEHDRPRRRRSAATSSPPGSARSSRCRTRGSTPRTCSTSISGARAYRGVISR